MDIFDTIREDHETILALVDAIEDTALTRDPTSADGARLEHLRDQLIALVEAHTAAEETLFYPLLQDDDDGRPLMVMALEQHHVVSLLLQEVRTMAVRDEHFVPKCAILAENLEDHIDEEEEDIFPLIGDLISAEQADTLGQQFRKRVSDEMADHRKAA